VLALRRHLDRWAHPDPSGLVFTNTPGGRNTTFMTWNLLHTARMPKDAGGVPAPGNQRSEWDAGCHFEYPNPGHR
jgi:hypothetical protein